jgi:predicted nucleic-acid-binding protein
VIGLDTNVLVRYLTQDDAAQARVVSRLIERELSTAKPGLVLAVVLAETLWVLGDLYGATESEKVDCAERLLATRQLKMQHKPAVERAVQAARSASCGLVDCLIAEIAADEGCDHVATFDRKAGKQTGFSLLKA